MSQTFTNHTPAAVVGCLYLLHLVHHHGHSASDNVESLWRGFHRLTTIPRTTLLLCDHKPVVRHDTHTVDRRQVPLIGESVERLLATAPED
jgi:hypothetical protein